MTLSELVLSFFLGVVLVLVSGVFFRLKTRGLFRLLINAILGAITLLILSALHLFAIPLRAVNTLIVGYLGIFGVLLLILLGFI